MPIVSGVDKLEIFKKYFLYVIIIVEAYVISQISQTLYITEEKRVTEKNEEKTFYQNAYFKLDSTTQIHIRNEKFYNTDHVRSTGNDPNQY